MKSDLDEVTAAADSIGKNWVEGGSLDIERFYERNKDNEFCKSIIERWELCLQSYLSAHATRKGNLDDLSASKYFRYCSH